MPTTLYVQKKVTGEPGQFLYYNSSSQEIAVELNKSGLVIQVIIDVPVNYVSNITCKSYDGTTYYNNVSEPILMYLPHLGYWEFECVDTENSNRKTSYYLNIDSLGNYYIDLNYCESEIRTVFPAGSSSSCTCSCDSVTLSATSSEKVDGYVAFKIPFYGTWEVTSGNNSQSIDIYEDHQTVFVDLT